MEIARYWSAARFRECSWCGPAKDWCVGLCDYRPRGPIFGYSHPVLSASFSIPVDIIESSVRSEVATASTTLDIAKDRPTGFRGPRRCWTLKDVQHWPMLLCGERAYNGTVVWIFPPHGNHSAISLFLRSIHELFNCRLFTFEEFNQPETMSSVKIKVSQTFIYKTVDRRVYLFVSIFLQQNFAMWSFTLIFNWIENPESIPLQKLLFYFKTFCLHF